MSREDYPKVNDIADNVATMAIKGGVQSAALQVKFRALGGNIESLGRLRLVDLAQIKTSSSDDIPDELIAIRDLALDAGKVWDESAILGVMKTFREHEFLKGAQVGLTSELPALLDDSDFVRYLVASVASPGLKSILYDCFNILCQASILDSQKKQQFFTTFPPPKEELKCLGGTATRFNDILEKMQAQEGFDSVALDSVHSALSQMVELIKPHIETGYQIHTLPCVKYVVGLALEEEIKKLDPHAMPVLYDIPTSVMMDVFNQFPKILRKNIVDSLSLDLLKEQSEAEIAIAKQKAIKQANEDYAEEYKDNEPLATDLFDNAIDEDLFIGHEDADERVSFACSELAKALNKLGVKEEGVLGFFEKDEGLSEYIYKKNILDQLMRYRIEKILATAPEVLNTATATAAALPDVKAMNIYSKSIAGTIAKLIASDDVDNKAKAVEILYTLCNKAPGVPYTHFVEILDSELGKIIQEKLTEIVAKKILPDGYLSKITNRGRYDLRDGILQRFTEYKEKNDQFKQLASSVQAAGDRSILLARLMYCSTEDLLEIVDGCSGLDLVNILQSNPNTCFDPNINKEKAFLHLVLRPDFASGILLALNGKINELEFDDGENCLHFLLLNNVINSSLVEAIINSVAEVDRGSFVNKVRTSDDQTPLYIAAYRGDLEIVTALIAAEGVDVNTVDKYGQTPLFISTCDGNLEIVTALLKAENIDVNKARTSDGATPLFVAASNGHAQIVTALIVAGGVDVNKVETTYDRTPLHIAAQNGNLEIVTALLKAENIDVNKDLFKIVREGNVTALKSLLDAGVDPNTLYGQTPLFIAAQNGNLEIVTALLTTPGIDVNKVATIYGQTPLFIAAQNGHAQTVIELIAAEGVDVNKARASDGATPLYIAATNGHNEIVSTLLAEKGVDVNKARTSDGTTPLYIAVQNGHAQIVTSLLAEKGVDVNKASTSDDANPLRIAAQNGHAQIVTSLLAEKGVDVNKASTSDGATPLWIAAQNGHTQTVTALIAATYIDVNKARTSDGTTPLWIAAQNGHTQTVTALIAAEGIEVNKAKTSDKTTPLWIAAQNGHTQIVTALIAAEDIDVNKVATYGTTPLLMAAYDGNLEVVTALIAAEGIKVDQAIAHGTTPLCVVAQKGHAQIATTLLANGARLDRRVIDVSTDNCKETFKNIKETYGQLKRVVAGLSPKCLCRGTRDQVDNLQEFIDGIDPGIKYAVLNLQDNGGNILAHAVKHDNPDAFTTLKENGVNDKIDVKYKSWGMFYTRSMDDYIGQKAKHPEKFKPAPPDGAPPISTAPTGTMPLIIAGNVITNDTYL